MFIRTFQNHSASLKRGLGLLLVVLILYGTTVEAAHRHGRISPASGNATSLTGAEQTSTPVSGQTSCSDCLICQLQHSFNTTLIAFGVVDPPTQVHARIASSIPRDVLSQVSGPTFGRAPPVIS